MIPKAAFSEPGKSKSLLRSPSFPRCLAKEEVVPIGRLGEAVPLSGSEYRSTPVSVSVDASLSESRMGNKNGGEQPKIEGVHWDGGVCRRRQDGIE